VLVAQHELDVAKSGHAQGRVDRLLGGPDRGPVRGGRPPADPGDGQAVPVAARPERHPGVGIGSLLRLGPHDQDAAGPVRPAATVTGKGAEVAQAGGDVAQVPEHPPQVTAGAGGP
jgi:hypothetical protein